MTLFGGFTPPAAKANLRGVFHGIYCHAAEKSAEKRREIKKLLIFVITKNKISLISKLSRLMRQQNYKKDFNGQNIFVGIDVHLRTWSVSVALPGGYLKTHTQKASAKELFEHLKKNYPNGTYHAVYESGFSGYSTCFALRELGVDALSYMLPMSLPRRRRR